MSTTLIFIRHGETAINTRGKLHKLYDTEPLSEAGRKQIQATVNTLKKYKLSKIYSSEEQRALESGKLIAEGLQIPLESLMELHERDWGDFAGKEWPEVQKILDKLTLEERYNYVSPNGESWKTAESRLIKVVHTIIENNPNKTIAIVTHGGSIRILMPYLLNMPKEESFKHNPQNASLTIFIYENGIFTNKSIDDVSHLKNL